MENKNALNDREIRQVNGGTERLLPKDPNGNIMIAAAPNNDSGWQTLDKGDSPVPETQDIGNYHVWGKVFARK